MKDQFILNFPDGMPEGTAQQKRITKTKSGKYVVYEKNSVKVTRNRLLAELLPHRPGKISEKPIRLIVFFAFDVKDKQKWGKYKTTRPDTDNCLKLLKDLMTGLWYKDDSQVVDERVVKVYSEQASIMIKIEELGDRP